MKDKYNLFYKFLYCEGYSELFFNKLFEVPIYLKKYDSFINYFRQYYYDKVFIFQPFIYSKEFFINNKLEKNIILDKNEFELNLIKLFKNFNIKCLYITELVLLYEHYYKYKFPNFILNNGKYTTIDTVIDTLTPKQLNQYNNLILIIFIFIILFILI